MIAIALCFVAGGVVALLFAWGTSVVTPTNNAFNRYVPVQEWPSAPPEGWPAPKVGMNTRAWNFTYCNASSGPRQTDPWMETWSYGVPFRCVSQRTRLGEEGVNIHEWEWGPDLGELTPGRVPTHILWLGLALDGTIWGALVWVLGRLVYVGWRIVK